MNEGHLGKFSFGGERAATDDHPVILHYLPLDASATSKIEVGTLQKLPLEEANPDREEPSFEVVSRPPFFDLRGL